MATLLSHKIKDKINKNDMKYCRICTDETCTFGDKWTKPCKCKGSIEWVHLSCLKTWIKHSNKLICDMCLTPYKLIHTKEKGRTVCESILNYVNPKIAPLSFTIFFTLIIFDLSYILNSEKDGLLAFFQILKTYTSFMFITVILLELYLGSFSIVQQDLLEVYNIFGRIGIFFMLPISMFKIFREICFNATTESINNEIIDVNNYDG